MTEIPTDIAAEVRPGMWAPGWPHEKPDHPFSVPEAHQAMQGHRECSIDGCPRKAAAHNALVAAGELLPDPSRRR